MEGKAENAKAYEAAAAAAAAANNKVFQNQAKKPASPYAVN